jgi:hypothetical protein
LAALENDLIRLLFAILKHQAKNFFGEDALGIAAETLVEIGGEKVKASLESLLGTQEGGSRLLEATRNAETCFQQKCDDVDIRTAFTMPMGDLPSVQFAIRELPKALDEQSLLETLRNNLKRDFHNSLTDEQIETGVKLYSDCLRHALLPLKDYTLQIVGQAVLRSEKRLNEIGIDVQKIKNILEESKLSDSTLPSNLKSQLFHIDPWIQPLALEKVTKGSEISFAASHTILDALNTDRKIVLVGNSGSGKTFALKSVSNQLNESSRLSCCWIPLKNYSKNLGHTIRENLGWRNVRDDHVISILEQQNVTLLFDGLNEITVKDQDDCIKEIDILLNNYQGQVCISYTTSDSAYFGFDYPIYKVLPLSKNDIEKTIKDFFKAKEEHHKADWFLQSIRSWDPERQQYFDKLANLPINLQFLLELAQYTNFSYNSLGDLYGQVIQKRLERTKLHNQRNQLSTDLKTDCLMELAYQSILKDHQLQMQKEFIRETFAEVINSTKAEVDLALKEVVRAGLLLEVNEFLLEWPHSSFRDYLAGRQIFNFIETEKPFKGFPLDKPNGLTAAAHATRLLTSQSRKLEKRNLIFLAMLDKHPNLEALKTIAEEYRPPINYYVSTNQEIKYEESEFSKTRWGERFVETYNQIKLICQKNGIEGTERIPIIHGLNIYFDGEKDFCLIMFSHDIGINVGKLETLDQQLSRRSRRKNSKAGFCLFAPFLSLLDPEIIAYLQIGLWLKHKVGKDQKELNDWHVGLTTYISPEKDWVYWQKQEFPKDDFEICASQEDAAKFIIKHFGHARLNEITTHMDLIGHSKREILGWNEIYMPITFEINPSKTIEQPRLESNRGIELMLRTLPNHNISLLLLLPMISGLEKTDFNAKIYIPFPIKFLNRYYFLYYQQEIFDSGKFSTFVHLRG